MLCSCCLRFVDDISKSGFVSEFLFGFQCIKMNEDKYTWIILFEMLNISFHTDLCRVQDSVTSVLQMSFHLNQCCKDKLLRGSEVVRNAWSDSGFSDLTVVLPLLKLVMMRCGTVKKRFVGLCVPLPAVVMCIVQLLVCLCLA